MANSISQKIIGLRRAAGLTQEQLGAKLGVSGQAVSKWERGEAMPDILLLPDLCGALGTTLDMLLDAKRAENPRSMEDFCEYAMKNGRVETVRRAIARLIYRGIHEPRDETLVICLENGENVLVSDPLGMGFVMSGAGYADFCLKTGDTKINSLIKLIADERTLAVIKTVAKHTSTVDEICAETGLERADVSEILLTLSNSAVIAHSRDKAGKTGYCPASGMVAVLMVLAACTLFDAENGGTRGCSWVSV